MPMSTTRLHRSFALVTAAVVLATMTAASVAAPASAAKPKCQGKTATIVGTNKADIIVGTAKRDVIVAKGGADRIFGRGGNDLICAGPGNDRLVGHGGIDKLIGGAGADKLFGGPGPDRLFAGPGPDVAAGQLGNDVIDGGLGVDTCYQNAGSGPVVRCEKPATPAAPAPAPAPKLLAIAYSDIDGNHQFGASDVLISKLEDTNHDGGASPGDLITMSRYPTELDASAFDDWGVSQHTVASVQTAVATELELTTTTGGVHRWVAAAQEEQYWEGRSLGSLDRSQIEDWHVAGHDDDIDMVSTSPSQPGNHAREVVNTTDDRFIDVDLFY